MPAAVTSRADVLTIVRSYLQGIVDAPEGVYLTPQKFDDDMAALGIVLGPHYGMSLFNDVIVEFCSYALDLKDNLRFRKYFKVCKHMQPNGIMSFKRHIYGLPDVRRKSFEDLRLYFSSAQDMVMFKMMLP